MSVSLEEFGELGISGQLVVTPRNSHLGPGPGLFCGVSGRVRRPVFCSASWTSVSPPAGQGS